MVNFFWISYQENGCKKVNLPILVILNMRVGQLIDVNKDNIFLKSFAIQKTGATFQALFNLATNYSRTNYVKFPVLHFFWKEEYEIPYEIPESEDRISNVWLFKIAF